MIISALVKRYEEANASEIPFGWQMRSVSHALDIDEKGKLLGILPLEIVDGKRKKRRVFLLPVEPPGRTSGIKEAFLCDNGGYLLGADPKKGKQKLAAAGELHERLLSSIDDPASHAIRKFFANAPPCYMQWMDAESAAKASFIFQVNGQFVDYENRAVRSVWNAYYVSEGEKAAPVLCLVSGQRVSPETTHGTLNLRGGQTSGSRLISANADSLTSYGKTIKGSAADIGKYAAFAYVTALNALINDESHRQFIGQDTLAFWAEKGGEAEESMFSILMNLPQTDERNRLFDTVKRMTQGLTGEEYKSERRFYLLCLSPNAARISIRFFYECSFGELIYNIQAHYARLAIASDGKLSYQYPPPWLLLSETTIGKKSSEVMPLLGGQLMYSILSNQKYPLTLYHAILMRIRAGETIGQAKAAIIKAILIKNFFESEVTTVALNEQSNNRAYVLGRLFAVLERLQEQANNSSNIRERYFTSASANPGSVFPTLLSLSMHHSDKLENSVFFEKLKSNLIFRLDAETAFPAVLNLEDQGKFIIGYYHQRQSFFTKNNSKEEKNNE